MTTNMCRLMQGGFCRHKHRHKSTDPKIGPEGRKAGQDPQENGQKQRKPTDTQGPYPDLRGPVSKPLPYLFSRLGAAWDAYIDDCWSELGGSTGRKHITLTRLLGHPACGVDLSMRAFALGPRCSYRNLPWDPDNSN
jgi:hypothetical protein